MNTCDCCGLPDVACKCYCAIILGWCGLAFAGVIALALLVK